MVLISDFYHPIYVVTENVKMHSKRCWHFLKKRKRNLDKKCSGEAVLMELSKASDTLNHDLLIAKINECWFQHDVLKRIYSYLINR